MKREFASFSQEGIADDYRGLTSEEVKRGREISNIRLSGRNAARRCNQESAILALIVQRGRVFMTFCRYPEFYLQATEVDRNSA